MAKEYISKSDSGKLDKDYTKSSKEIYEKSKSSGNDTEMKEVSKLLSKTQSEKPLIKDLSLKQATDKTSKPLDSKVQVILHFRSGNSSSTNYKASENSVPSKSFSTSLSNTKPDNKSTSFQRTSILQHFHLLTLTSHQLVRLNL